MHTAQYLLENLGFVINLEKSCFQPTQQLEFLGFLVNTRDMTLLLPDCKVSSIKTLCSTLLSQRDVSVRELSRLIGKLTASIQAVFPAPLHYRNLQQLKHQALSRDRSFDSRISLSIEAIDELRWWLAHLDAWNGRALLHPSLDLIIETDASRMGWGAVCQGVRTGGLWSQMEQKLHINCLELLAGSFAIKSFTKNRLCVHVRLRMDNTSAVVYLNRLGGTRSLVLSNLALALWEWALTRNIFLSAEHIAGNQYVSADWELRKFLDSSNWKLCPEIFRSLMQIRGPCAIDLFVDRLNCQLPQFCSWKPDPRGYPCRCDSAVTDSPPVFYSHLVRPDASRIFSDTVIQHTPLGDKALYTDIFNTISNLKYFTLLVGYNFIWIFGFLYMDIFLCIRYVLSII